MKKLFLTGTCLLFASLAFAQTSTNPPDNTRYYTNKVGSITAFEPGTSITINGNLLTHEAKYAVSRNVHYRRKGGGAITPSLLRTGSRVELGFNREGQVEQISLVEGR